MELALCDYDSLDAPLHVKQGRVPFWRSEKGKKVLLITVLSIVGLAIIMALALGLSLHL